MTTPNGKFYIPSLDGVRAFAFLLVFLSHAGVEAIPGGLGVSVFFFLSGYLITTLLRREHDRFGRIDLKKFYMRRVLRIWPAFYLVLFLAIVTSVLVGFYSQFTDEHYHALISLLFHYSNYFNIEFTNRSMPLGTEVYWSLAVEEHFYLVFPFIYILLRKMKMGASRQAIVLWSICLGILLWRCYLIFTFGETGTAGYEEARYNRIFFGTDTRVDCIILGCAMAVFGNPAIESDRQVSVERLKYLYLPAGFMLLLSTLLIRNLVFRDTLRYTFQAIAFYPFFIMVIRFPQWPICQPLNWRWVKFIGVLSYSLYLIHFTVIKTLIRVFPEANLVGIAIVSLLISLVLSYGVYRFVEQPVGKIKHKFATAK